MRFHIQIAFYSSSLSALPLGRISNVHKIESLTGEKLTLRFSMYPLVVGHRPPPTSTSHQQVFTGLPHVLVLFRFCVLKMEEAWEQGHQYQDILALNDSQCPKKKSNIVSLHIFRVLMYLKSYSAELLLRVYL